MTTPKRTFKRSVKRATTAKPEKKQDSKPIFRMDDPNSVHLQTPGSAELMKMYGIRWGVYNGRRVLNVPSTAPANALKEVIEALNNERN